VVKVFLLKGRIELLYIIMITVQDSQMLGIASLILDCYLIGIRNDKINSVKANEKSMKWTKSEEISQQT